MTTKKIGWSYSKYRTSLYLDGKRFAIVTLDEQNSLSDENASFLIESLNKKSPDKIENDGVGQWFYAGFGYKIEIGQCVARSKDGGYILRFKWSEHRIAHLIAAHNIYGEAQDPRWISRLRRFFRRANKE